MAIPTDNLYITDLPGEIDDDSLRTIFEAYGTVVQCKALPIKPAAGNKRAGMVRVGSVEEAEWIVDNLNGNIPQGLAAAVKVQFADTPESKAQKWAGGGDKGGYGKAAANGSKGSWSTPYSGGGKNGFTPAGAWTPSWSDHKGGKSNGKGAGKDGGKGTDGITDIIKGLCAAQALPGTDGYSHDANALYISGLPPDTTDLDLYKIFASFGAIPPRGVRAMMGEDGSCKGIGFVNYVDAGALEAAILTLNGTTLPSGRIMTVKPKGPGGKGKGKDGKE